MSNHQWGPGPDGPLYHCTVCKISKVDDHDGYTCARWLARWKTGNPRETIGSETELSSILILKH